LLDSPSYAWGDSRTSIKASNPPIVLVLRILGTPVIRPIHHSAELEFKHCRGYPCLISFAKRFAVRLNDSKPATDREASRMDIFEEP